MSMPEQDQLQPDLEMITLHMTTAKGDVMEGLFEVVGLKEVDGRKQVKSRLFTTDQIEEAAQFAADTNVEGFSLYLSAAILSPDTAPMGRPNDEDFFVSNVVWADYDHEGAAEGAAAKVKQLHAIPWYCVDTGLHPYRRTQMFWLVEPIHDPELLRSINAAIAQSTGGDSSVINPSRFMRLGGTIAWPTKPGRVPELTRFYKVSDIEYPVERLQQVFGADPQQAGTEHTHQQERAYSTGPSPFDSLKGKVPQGQRDLFMARCVMRAFKVYVGENGCAPSRDELADEAWAPFERGTGLKRTLYEDRKIKSKAQYLLRKFTRGGYPEWPNEEAVVADYQSEPQDEEEAPFQTHEQFEEQAANVPPGEMFQLKWFGDYTEAAEALDFVEDTLVENGLTVVYGDSNVGKTFFAADLGLSVALGRPWNGKEVDQGGVVYCVLEGGLGMNNRLAAFRKANPFLKADIPFAVIADHVNMFDATVGDVARLIATIKAAAARMSVPMKLIVIDTLARAMSGGNENSTEDMGILVNNADAIRHATGAAVLFVHHSGKDAAKGARGSSALRAATDTEIELAKDDVDSRITKVEVKKQRDLDGGQVYRFARKVIELGTNRRGKPITSCVVEYLDPNVTPAPPPPALTNAQVHAVFDEIRRRWVEKRPFGKDKRSGGRWLTGYLVGEYGLNQKVAQDYVENWERYECIAEEVYDSHTKARGWRVLQLPAREV